MLYHCLHCQHEQDNPDGLPLCPQCAQNWVPVSSTADNTSEIVQAPPLQPQPVVESILSDSHPEKADLNHNISLGTDAFASKVPSTQESPETITLKPLFSFEVNLGSITLTAERLTLEVRFTNAGRETISGSCCLSAQGGSDGTPGSFTLTADRGHWIIPLSLSSFPVEGGLLHLKVDDGSTGHAFWQGYLTIQPQQDNQITVNISNERNIQNSTVLEGLDNNVNQNVHINTKVRQDDWKSIPLFLSGTKSLARSADISASFRHLKHYERPVSYDKGRTVETRSVKTARLTIARSTSQDESYVNLLAGRKAYLGRQKTLYCDKNSLQNPNDIYLRTLRENPQDGYISRQHGVLKFTEHGVCFQNFSAGGTTVGATRLSTERPECLLINGMTIQPGTLDSRNQINPLILKTRITQNPVSEQPYNLLATDRDFQLGMPKKIGPHSAVTIERNDNLSELEKYIFFQNSFQIGRASNCAWQIHDNSIQDIHARILFIDNSFWIEPFDSHCHIAIRNTKIELNHLTRLLPDETLIIGDLNFVIFHEWFQHIVNCTCCKGHGYQFGCRCSDCEADYKNRPKR